MITTTLNRIRDLSPCKDGWENLLSGLSKTRADDEPLPYAKIVEINGVDDALWACKAEPQHAKEWRLFAVWCAREALKYTNDWRPVNAVNIAERYAHGMASADAMGAACGAASDAASDAAWAAAWPPFTTVRAKVWTCGPYAPASEAALTVSKAPRSAKRMAVRRSR